MAAFAAWRYHQVADIKRWLHWRIHDSAARPNETFCAAVEMTLNLTDAQEHEPEPVCRDGHYRLRQEHRWRGIGA